MAGKADLARHERFARLLAQGLTIAAAKVIAGFSPGSSWPRRLSHRPSFQARVEILRDQAALVGPDLAPVILRLFDAAAKAMTLESGGAFAAAARMLSEAARLKRIDGPGGLGAGLAADPESLDQWAARWGPDD